MATSEIARGEVIHTLAENEATFRQHAVSFIAAGQALMEIRDHHQYVDAGFDTFEDYCKDRWDIGIRYSENLMSSARVAGLLPRNCAVNLKEGTVRPLVKILNQDGERAVTSAWSQIVAKHKDDGPITGREVQRFLTLGANYNKPGWHELIGAVGDDLNKTSAALAKFEKAVGSRELKSTREKAIRYAELAENIAARLRGLAA